MDATAYRNPLCFNGGLNARKEEALVLFLGGGEKGLVFHWCETDLVFLIFCRFCVCVSFCVFLIDLPFWGGRRGGT